MNREIKFRAWDKEHHIMSYSPVNKINFAGQIHLHSGWADVEDTCYILMQYIGLKDTADQKAYQGDIIGIYDDFENTLISKHEIIWGGKQYPAFTLKPSLQVEENDFSYLSCAVDAPKWLVLGNIYENPELLEKGATDAGRK